MNNYTVIEEEIMAEMKQSLSIFFPQDWQIGRDDAVMNRGGDYLAILRSSGNHTSTTWSNVDVLNNLVFPIEVYARFYKNIDESKKRMSEIREQLCDLLRSYNFLRNTAGVMETSFVVGELQYVYLENAPAPVFLQHVFNVTVSLMVERGG